MAWLVSTLVSNKAKLASDNVSNNSFLATRKETSSPNEITFSIVKVIDDVNKHDSINFDTNDELSDFKNDIVQRTIQRVSEGDAVGKTKA